MFERRFAFQTTIYRLDINAKICNESAFFITFIADFLFYTYLKLDKAQGVLFV